VNAGRLNRKEIKGTCFPAQCRAALFIEVQICDSLPACKTYLATTLAWSSKRCIHRSRVVSTIISGHADRRKKLGARSERIQRLAVECVSTLTARDQKRHRFLRLRYRYVDSYRHDRSETTGSSVKSISNYDVTWNLIPKGTSVIREGILPIAPRRAIIARRDCLFAWSAALQICAGYICLRVTPCPRT